MNEIKPQPNAASESEQSGFSFPTAYTILFSLIVVVAALTWIIPAGEYDKTESEILNKEIPVAGTYKTVEGSPQGFEDVILAPIAGFYNPDSYEANAIDVALFVLVIGGFLGVVTRSGAITAGISRAMRRFEGREMWMIPLLMGLFALGGTTYGMAEETLAFYMLIIPVMLAAGFDAATAVAIILIGAGIGVLGSTVNAFATVIASNASGIPFTQGLTLRIVILLTGWLTCVAFVMRYARRVKNNPALSIVADKKTENDAYFLTDDSNRSDEDTVEFTGQHKVILLIFALTFGIMIWGVSVGGWWMARMSALFLASSIVIGIVARLGEKGYTGAFVKGASELLGVALIIGIARGIVVVMDGGQITHTILHWAEQAIGGLHEVVFINALYWVQVALSFFVPSTSGLAVLTMPIMAPLSDFAGVGRDLAVTAYQSASGIVNLITPTSAVVMGGLAIGRIPYERWLRFIFPLLIILTLEISVFLSVGAMIGSS